jgi:hypothetical protein
MADEKGSSKDWNPLRAYVNVQHPGNTRLVSDLPGRPDEQLCSADARPPNQLPIFSRLCALSSLDT